MPEPTELTAGTTAKWTKSLPDYPAGEWTLVYALRSANDKLDVTATANGTDYDVTITATESDTLSAGRYAWQAVVSKGDETYLADQGFLTVKKLLSAADTFDPRTQNEKNLEALDAVIAGKASADVLEYTINGRQLRRYPIKELIALRNHYAALVASEKAALRNKQGGGVLRSIDFVFDGGEL